METQDRRTERAVLVGDPQRFDLHRTRRQRLSIVAHAVAANVSHFGNGFRKRRGAAIDFG